MEYLKKIPDEKKLIIFDFFGTLIYDRGNERLMPKEGVAKLLQNLYQNQKSLAISSDVSFEELDIRHLFNENERTYPNWNNYFKNKIFQGENSLIKYDEGPKVKNLGDILKLCENTPKQDAIFVGDNYLSRDERSAKAFDIDFIWVNEKTDFLNLYGG